MYIYIYIYIYPVAILLYSRCSSVTADCDKLYERVVLSSCRHAGFSERMDYGALS